MSLIALPVACRVDGKAMDGVTSLLPDLQGGPLWLRLGPEMLVNGGFDTDTNWVKGAGWAISGGQATATTPGVTSDLRQDLSGPTIELGKKYLATIVFSSLTAPQFVMSAQQAGAVVFNLLPVIGTAGPHARLIASATGNANQFAIRASATAIASIDRVSLREVL